MKVITYPADNYGCGHHRVIWPARYLADQGVDVEVVQPAERQLQLEIRNDRVVKVHLKHEVDVLVLQRVTHLFVQQAIPLLREQGIAVVIDIDDDLATIHPDNPAHDAIHPKWFGKTRNGERHLHSWKVLADACRDATLVTVSTSALLDRYATHGRGVVIHNYLADHYYQQRHDDSALVGWAASLHSHPNDPAVVGPAIARLTREGVQFRVFSELDGVVKAFGLDGDPDWVSSVDLLDWPKQVAELGVGIAPLADTKFNAAKSWLKPLELAACGVPWVGSPRAEYRRLHELGCGFLADRPKDWYKLVKNLVKNPSLRAEASEAGVRVAQQLKLRDHAWRWSEAWDLALRLQRG